MNLIKYIRARQGSLSFLSAISLLLLWGCDDFVSADRPNFQLSADEVFLEMGTATAAMTDVYSKMRDAGVLSGGSGGQSLLLGLYSDELDWYQTTQSNAQSFYSNNIPQRNAAVLSIWNNAYNQLFAANLVIAGAGNSTALPPAGRDQLVGEALFARALLHSCLAQLFGEIPYVTSTDPNVNRVAPKLSVQQVLAMAKDDLETALPLLGEDYVTANRVRPNRYAAYALLARVCLEKGDLEESSDAASAVLNNTALYDYSGLLENTFSIGSASTIWQLGSGTGDGNTAEAATFIFSSGPPPRSALSDGLMASFEAGDLRKEAWTKAVSNGTDIWHHAYKYKKNQTTSPSQEYSVVLRLGELYLIRAEARARSGFLTGAKEDLNKVRNKAGLGDTPSLSQETILDAVLAERRVELFTEQGRRFFDLKRYGMLDAVLSPQKPGWTATDSRLPLPESELSLNPNLLPQNPGY